MKNCFPPFSTKPTSSWKIILYPDGFGGYWNSEVASVICSIYLSPCFFFPSENRQCGEYTSFLTYNMERRNENINTNSSLVCLQSEVGNNALSLFSAWVVEDREVHSFFIPSSFLYLTYLAPKNGE